MLDQITPLVLTYNEEANIRRLLQSLEWARRVVVVDSDSTDGTRNIATEFTNTDFVVRRFDGLARQWSFGLTETGIESDWILALDADYVLPPAFVEELRRLDPAANLDGYFARFKYCIEGVPLRGALYPPVTVLFRRLSAHFVQDGHAHRVQLAGGVEGFSTQLLHDDRKPLGRWFLSQVEYMKLEARKLQATPIAELGWTDRMRKLVIVAPVAAFFFCLFVKGNLLDGRRGLLYALQRATAEAILSIYLVETALRPGRPDEG